MGTWASSTAASHDASGRGSERRSVGSGPTATSSAVTTSTIRRAIGPLVDMSIQLCGVGPPPGIRPSDGFIPDSPQQADGRRIEPPPSDPVAKGTMPAASAAAEPPDDPPGPCPVSNGLAVGPKRAFEVLDDHANSGMLVLPTTMHPAARRRATNGLSTVAGATSASTGAPCVVRKPTASWLSLTAERDPGEYSGIAAVGDDLIERGGVRHCPLRIQRDEGVVARVEGRDAIEGHRGELAGAHLAGANRVGEVCQGCGAEVHRGPSGGVRGSGLVARGLWFVVCGRRLEGRR